MDIEKATKIFLINDIFEENRQSIKKKYKKIAAKYHPDSPDGSTDKMMMLSDAYNVLCEAIKNVEEFQLRAKSNNKEDILITIQNLTDIYNDKTIKLKHKTKDKCIELNRHNIRDYNLLVSINGEITHNNKTNKFSVVKQYNESSNYDINLEILVDKLTEQEDIKITIQDYEKSFKMSSQLLRLKSTLAYPLSITFIIEKKIVA